MAKELNEVKPKELMKHARKALKDSKYLPKKLDCTTTSTNDHTRWKADAVLEILRIAILDLVSDERDREHPAAQGHCRGSLEEVLWIALELGRFHDLPEAIMHPVYVRDAYTIEEMCKILDISSSDTDWRAMRRYCRGESLTSTRDTSIGPLARIAWPIEAWTAVGLSQSHSNKLIELLEKAGYTGKVRIQ